MRRGQQKETVLGSCDYFGKDVMIRDARCRNEQVEYFAHTGGNSIFAHGKAHGL